MSSPMNFKVQFNVGKSVKIKPLNIMALILQTFRCGLWHLVYSWARGRTEKSPKQVPDLKRHLWVTILASSLLLEAAEWNLAYTSSNEDTHPFLFSYIDQWVVRSQISTYYLPTYPKEDGEAHPLISTCSAPKSAYSTQKQKGGFLLLHAGM